jgi:glycopeptide antibiotics resistance protein
MRYRVALLISILFIVPLGYVVRHSQSLGLPWLHDLLGSVAYEIFWILLVAFLYPKASPKWTAIGVCLATCSVEFFQLWHPPFLQAVRSTLLGRLVLGTTFSGFDFISYFVGSFAGWLWLRSLNRAC